jgi:hypothetical protein
MIAAAALATLVVPQPFAQAQAQPPASGWPLSWLFAVFATAAIAGAVLFFWLVRLGRR